MTMTRNPIWELSPAYEQWNAERREHVIDTLYRFGADGPNSWPIRAHVSSVMTPRMHPSAMHNYVLCGTQGIKRQIDRKDMPAIYDWPNESFFECWFVPAVHGNTDNDRPSEWELVAYITTVHQLIVVHLGCDHQDKLLVRTANQYRRYECQTCEYTWGEDTSG